MVQSREDYLNYSENVVCEFIGMYVLMHACVYMYCVTHHLLYYTGITGLASDVMVELFWVGI